eukprot:gene4947-8727_t
MLMASRTCTFLLSIIFFAAASTAVVVVIVLSTVHSGKTYKYAVAIDAGSSHSDVSLYTWKTSKRNVSTDVLAVPRMDQVKFSCSTSKGISTFASADQAALSLEDCLSRAETELPKSKVGHTPVLLRATAGMRVLKEDNRTKAENILAACETLFRNSKFSGVASSALILPGSEEGAFGWVATNYIKKYFHQASVGKDIVTAGALDMGGASTQITFNDPVAYSNLAPADQYQVTLFQQTFQLYTHSYLCFGINAARQRVFASILQAVRTKTGNITVNNPCLPIGYSIELNEEDIRILRSDFCTKYIIFSINITKVTMNGSSNPVQCQSFVLNLIKNGPGTRMGTNQPNIPDQSFFAFSGYYYFVNYTCGYRKLQGCRRGESMGWHISIENIDIAALKICKESAEELRYETPLIPDKNLMDYCFQGNYISAVLDTGYGFSRTEQQIEFVDEVEGQTVGWSLGMLLVTASMERNRNLEPLLVSWKLAVVASFCGFMFICSVWLFNRNWKAFRTAQYQALV